jgi:hypothetical protein
MLPRELKPDDFKSYPPEARKLVLEHLGTCQNLPLAYLPNLLREVIEFDSRFPVERRALEKELANLQSLTLPQREDWFGEFAQIRLSPALESSDWVNSPAQFVEQLSAHLWVTHQLDAFRKAAIDYADRLHKAVPPEPPLVARLGIAVIGQGVTDYEEPLFRKLRPHGAYFNRVKPEGGLETLLRAVAGRAKKHPIAYGHWYVDGGQASGFSAVLASGLTCVSYRALESARAELLRQMHAEIEKPGMGPEALRTLLARKNPQDLGFSATGDAVLDRFQMKVLTEGSGTQIFSTTFAQWTAREALRRAQPCTLLVRFAPRQRQKPMNELLSDKQDQADLDPIGSLVDADLGAYYNWINQQRLPGAEQSSFLAWFENHGEAVAIGPAMPRGTESESATDLAQLLSWMV